MVDHNKPTKSYKIETRWGRTIEARQLVSQKEQFIVYLDEALDIQWYTSDEWDKKHPNDKIRFREVINAAANLESSDWDGTDERRTLNFKRQIAEAIACALEEDYDNAEKMLATSTTYQGDVLTARATAIVDQVTISDKWKKLYEQWTTAHYTIGTAALFLSTLVATKPTLLLQHSEVLEICAWLVAFLTGLLTFLTPDKKAGKYLRAWSRLHHQITRYQSDRNSSLEAVFSAYQQGEAIVSEIASPPAAGTKTSEK